MYTFILLTHDKKGVIMRKIISVLLVFSMLATMLTFTSKAQMPTTFDISFYLSIEDEKAGNVYAKFSDLSYSDEIQPPAVPTREGYVFKGWICKHSDSLYTYYQGYPTDKVSPKNGTVFCATWCKEEDYVKPEVVLSYNKIDTQGKNYITLKLLNSNGRFNAVDILLGRSFYITSKNNTPDERVYLTKAFYVDEQTVVVTVEGMFPEKFDYKVYFPQEYVIWKKPNHPEEAKVEIDPRNVELNSNGFPKRWYTSSNSISNNGHYDPSKDEFKPLRLKAPETKTISFDSFDKSLGTPVKKNDTYLFPLRLIANELEHGIKWDETRRMVILTDEYNIERRIFPDNMQYCVISDVDDLNSVCIINDRTYLSMEELRCFFPYEFTYDSTKNTMEFTKLAAEFE